jgi:beta-glucosidase
MPRTLIYLAAARLLLSAYATLPYLSPALPVADRVRDLISRMTPLELAHQTINKNEGGWGDLPDILAEFGSTGIGSLFIDECMNKSSWGHANVSAWSTPLEALRARNALQAAFLASSRLAIPVSFCMEGLHSGAWGGTAFPAPPALAATWNSSLVTLIGQTIALEARASGVDTALSPVVNMFSDPRFGRYSEGFSPDPHVSAALGAAMVRGLQGGDNSGGASAYLPDFNKTVASQAKHFAAYGHAASGLDGGVAELTNRSLFEIYLKPWRAMAACGLRSLMVAHQTVNDIPCHGNAWLINGVMRGEYGFDGVTISDEQNIPHLGPGGWAVAENITHSAAVALTAGVDLDLESGATNATLAYFWLLDALADGLISLADLQAAAARVLTLKFATGLFDFPFAPEARLAELQAPAHLALALDAARQGIVLAKNAPALLPLAPSAAAPLRLALLGPFLDCAFGAAPVGDPTPGFCTAREALLGPYAQDNGQYAVPLLPEALAALAAPGLSWTVSQGASATAYAGNASLIAAAVAAAAAADVAVLVLGDALGTLDEGTSRSSLDLTPGQLALLQAVAAETTVPIVLVLLSGHPTSFGPGPNAVLDRVASVLIAQHPGQLGAQAIAEVLLGVTNPSGKLADSWPLIVGHLGTAAQPFQQLANGEWQGITRAPADPDGRRYLSYYDDARVPTAPQFPMGWGLSYTTFVYGGITAAQTTPLAALPRALSGRAALRAAAAAVVVTASVRVCNTGARAGTEVVIVYARDPRGGSGGARRVVPYVKRIVGFARLPLDAGACGDAIVAISGDDLATHATDYAGANLQLTVLPGAYVFSTGANSRADVFNATVVVA